MPNTNDGKHNGRRKKDDPLLVIYAKECDPHKLDFDTWWANKRASFGGDDGIEFLNRSEIDQLAAHPPIKGAKPRALRIDISPEQLKLEIIWNTKPSK